MTQASWDAVLDTLEERLRIARRLIAAGPETPPVDMGPGPGDVTLPPPTPAQHARALALLAATSTALQRAENRRQTLDAGRAYGR